MLFGGERGTCPHCATVVRFVQQGSMNAQRTEGGEFVGQVQISVCPSCQGMVIFATDSLEWKSWRRYPLTQSVKVPGLPPRVEEAFREAQISLAAGAPHAAATMLRRTVASAATHLNVPDRDEAGHFLGLLRRIEGLKERLLPATYEAAQFTKLLGDGGAHEEAEDEFMAELGPIDAESVGPAVEVVGYILANLYEIPGKVAALRQQTGAGGDQP